MFLLIKKEKEKKKKKKKRERDMGKEKHALKKGYLDENI